MWAQQSSYQTNVERVEIPVSVVNRQGEPIRGLTVKNFQVEVDGRPAVIKTMEERTPVKEQVPAALPLMPPDTYTNLEAELPAQRVLLLIDYAHIPTENLLELNQEMGRWLANPLPGGVQIAIFEFDRNMTLIQPFTSDTHAILEAVRDMVGNHSGRGQLEGLSRELRYLGGIGTDVKADLFGGPKGDGPTYGDAMAAFIANEIRMIRHLQQTAERSQAISMLDTWEAFAHLLSGIPGHKNVVWLTASTTLMAANNHELVISQGRLHQVFAELNEAGVSLFPVDVTTLHSYTQDIDTPSFGIPGPRLGDPQTAIRARGLEDRQMDWAAQETGGEAFGPSNAVRLTMSKILQTTADGYVLSVTPPQGLPAKAIHRIRVSVHLRGARVLYRRSYLEQAPVDSRTMEESDLENAAALAFNPLNFGSLTVVAKTGDWTLADPPGQGNRIHRETLPLVVTSELAPLVHVSASGARYYDFSLLRILVPLDGSTGPLLLPERHLHSTLDRTHSVGGHFAVRVTSSCTIPAGHPYLLRLILRDNVNGHAGSISLRLNAPRPKRQLASMRH